MLAMQDDFGDISSVSFFDYFLDEIDIVVTVYRVL